MPNQLIHETSPYLLQHAHNPVEWYPWGEAALAKAHAENKPLLVSIGYAACHWCHVMERESFEDEEVAKLMNAHFVCIKVDREERPDIDKIYMDAVMLMTGRGGWPLNAIALPDGRPIYGGTYFRKDQWTNALQQVAAFYEQGGGDRAKEYATELVNAMMNMDTIAHPEEALPINADTLNGISREILDKADLKWGGRDVQANKFPLPGNHQFFLQLAHSTQNEALQNYVDTALEKMAFGGIYDHFGGGWARYSVDAYWKVPHFEKMLYDNGQMLSLYAEAYLQQPKALYAQRINQTLAFVNRELQSPEGGFYASLDADSEGEEGKFYVWDYEKVEEALGENLRPFADYYNLHPFGNWEGKNIPFVLESEEDFARQWKLDLAEFQQLLAEGREKLFAIREERVRPGLDDKILASWNGLMLKGCVDAYRATRNPLALEMAKANAAFLRDHMADGARLYRNYKEGKRTIPGFLDDYAHVIAGYVALYQVTFEEEWLHLAKAHVDHVLEHFVNKESDLLFYTSDEGEVLVRRKTERQDDVIPSSNAVMAHNLMSLSTLMDLSSYKEKALGMLDMMLQDVIKLPTWHGTWGQLMLSQHFAHYEIALAGPDIEQMRLNLESPYLPYKVFAGSSSPSELPLLQNRHAGQPTIYVCQGYACKLPVHTVEEAQRLMGRES